MNGSITVNPGQNGASPFDYLKADINRKFAQAMGFANMGRSGSAAPTANDIADGKYAVWYNTTTSTLAVYYNNAGSIVQVSGGGGGVTSFNARTGAVVPASGDYTFAQIGSTPTTVVGYGIADAVTLTDIQTLTNKTLTSPVLTTPTLGVATATSINKVSITAPTTSATLTLADGSTLATSGANSVTLTSTGPTTITLPTTGTLATLSGTETFANKTFSNVPTFSSLTTNGGLFYGNSSGVLQQSANLTFSSANNGVTLTSSAIGITGTDANGLILQNTTAATVSLLQYSPALSFDASGWNSTGGVAVPFGFRFVLQPLNATTNQANFVAQMSVNGAAYTTSFFVTQAGTFNATALSATNAVSGATFKFKTSVSSATTLTLSTSAMVYVFSGSSATTWTLPALSGNTDLSFFIKNRGSAAITLTRAGSDNLYTTASVTTFVINPGEGYTVTNDGSFWLIY